jgi:uncharacterized protein YcbK (DUF882 family)
MINWKDPEDQITDHFKVKDALMLRHWGRLATEQDGADFNKLLHLFQIMEQVRGYLGCPINVHCGFRSVEYNKSQGIKPADVHSMNLAVDFDTSPHMTIEETKAKLEPVLESMGLRMEKGTTTWVHL